MPNSKQESRREVAERIVRNTYGEIVLSDRRRLADAIEAALKKRDERAVRLIREHRASDKCDMDCWTTISAAIRNGDAVEGCACMKFITAPPERTRVEGEHPEDFCHKCGRPNIVWFAPNELWNKSVRAVDEPEILCPVCFVQLAEAAGFNGVWRVALHNYNATSDSARRAAEWRDEGGHVWEIRPNVDCVECPHCCFTFAAVHTDGYGDAYSCPNCKGCPDAAALADNDAESPRVVVNETKA